MHPTHGARLKLRLRSRDDESVRYDVRLFDPQQAWRGEAYVSLRDGSVELGSWQAGQAPPEWMRKMTSAFLKQTWRGRQKPHGPPWPRTLTRWRAAPT